MRKGDEILLKALDCWGEYDVTYAYFHQLLHGAEERPSQHLHAAIEAWTSGQRLKMIEAHLGSLGVGLDDAKPQDVEQFEVPIKKLMQVNGIVGFYKVPRAFMHLYVHAWLCEALGMPSPLKELDLLLDELSP